MTAQLTHVKGWSEYLRVVDKLSRAHPSLRALVIGDGPLRGALESEVSRMGLAGRVRFTGHLFNVERALACLDVYISMSRREGLSVAVIEALGSGLPCVITEIGGARDLVIDDRNGFVVPVGDVEAATARVRCLLGQRGARMEMGKASRRLCAERFDARKMVKSYQEIYLKAGGRVALRTA